MKELRMATNAKNFLYLETVRSHLIIVDREATSRIQCKEFY